MAVRFGFGAIGGFGLVGLFGPGDNELRLFTSEPAEVSDVVCNEGGLVEGLGGDFKVAADSNFDANFFTSALVSI